MTDPAISALLSLGDRATAAVVGRAAKAIAECVVRTGTELSARVRAGRAELIQEFATRSLGLRVICGQRAASISTNDVSDAGIDRIIRQALELAELSEPDRSTNWPEPALLWSPKDVRDLELYDPNITSIPADEIIARATEAEAAALSFDSRIEAGEGATCKTEYQSVAYVFSSGFRAAYRTSSLSLRVASAVADQGGTRRRASRWTAARHVADLESGVSIGQDAARRVISKLCARSVAACEVPVIFDSNSAGLLLKTLAQCVMGSSIWRGSCYLVGREGSYVASDLITVVDDATIPRAPGSRPFDGEGLASQRTVVIERGILRAYLCDTYAAGKLRRRSTANAVRGASAGISSAISNFILQAGVDSPQAILEGTKRGLYVTEMTGYGFNAVTGDFSRAVAGFWIEEGELAFPVTEVTVSLKIDELWQRIDAVGSDLRLRSSTESPTLRVARMSVAGHGGRPRSLEDSIG
jgi:PmbA protein